MATETVTLEHGLTYGERTLYEVTLREPTAGDIVEAQEEAEQPMPVPDARGNMTYQMVTSPTRLGYALMRRQVQKVGDVDGPLSMEEIKRLHRQDLATLEEAADRLDAATAQQAGEAVADRGRGESAPGGD